MENLIKKLKASEVLTICLCLLVMLATTGCEKEDFDCGETSVYANDDNSDGTADRKVSAYMEEEWVESNSDGEDTDSDMEAEDSEAETNTENEDEDGEDGESNEDVTDSDDQEVDDDDEDSDVTDADDAEVDDDAEVTDPNGTEEDDDGE